MRNTIIELIKGKDSKTFTRLVKSRPTIKEFVDDLTHRWGAENVNETLYCIVNECEPPRCPCGSKALFNSYTKGYRKFCDYRCPKKGEAHSSTMTQIWDDDPDRKEQVTQALKRTMLERYGADNAMHVPDIVDRVKQTNLERYGVEMPFQSEEIRKRASDSLMESHGVENPFQSEEIRKKAAASFEHNHGVPNRMQFARAAYHEKHGVENTFQVPEVKEKIKDTLVERYGVEHPLQSPEIREQMKENIIEKYGVENVAQSPEIQARIKATCVERYGVKNVFLHQPFQEKIKDTCVERYGVKNSSQIHYDDETIEFLSNDTLFTSEMSQIPVSDLVNKYKTSATTIYARARKLGIKPVVPPFTGRSSFEIEVEQFIRQHYTGTIVLNTREVISPQELDIWLPELNFAIECNGTWWHSELGGKEKTYHFDKTNKCREHGVQLFHLWEHTWQKKQELAKSMLLSRLQLSTRIPARKCQVSLVSNDDAVKFFEHNHIQGNAGFKVALGLFHKEQMVMCMSLAKPRYNKQYEWELIRMATLQGHSVVGGASKLLKGFINLYNPKNVLSYCDRSYGTGKVYEQLGFEFSHVSEQNYWYTMNNIDFYHRSRFQKHKLKNVLTSFDPNLTEWENMMYNGWNRIFDSGNDVYVWKK